MLCNSIFCFHYYKQGIGRVALLDTLVSQKKQAIWKRWWPLILNFVGPIKFLLAACMFWLNEVRARSASFGTVSCSWTAGNVQSVFLWAQ